jgi:predicted transcriptional regulator
MALVYPAEIEANIVLPAIRKAFCETAAELGIKQKDIAEHLGLTEGAVSQLLNGKRGSEIKVDADFREKVKGNVKKVLAGEISGFAAIQGLSSEFKFSGRLCDLHHKIGGVNSQTCGLAKVCLK